MKRKITLLVDASIMNRLQKITDETGKSAAELFEEFISSYRIMDSWKPPVGSATHEIMHAIPDELKLSSADYEEIKRYTHKKVNQIIISSTKEKNLFGLC